MHIGKLVCTHVKIVRVLAPIAIYPNTITKATSETNCLLAKVCVHFYLGGRRPRLPTGGPEGSTELLGFRMVSSTERMRLAASVAPVMALSLTTAGSHTKASKLLVMLSLVMSTPYHILPVGQTSDETSSTHTSLAKPKITDNCSYTSKISEHYMQSSKNKKNSLLFANQHK